MGEVVRRYRIPAVKRQAIGTPDRHRKGTPHGRWGRLVPVANRRAPRASRSALTFSRPLIAIALDMLEKRASARGLVQAAIRRP